MKNNKYEWVTYNKLKTITDHYHGETHEFTLNGKIVADIENGLYERIIHIYHDKVVKTIYDDFSISIEEVKKHLEDEFGFKGEE